MAYKILAINPGSTSTKIAIYEDEKLLCKTSIEHSAEEIQKYNDILEQYDFRYKTIMDFLNGVNIKPEELSAVVGRGGLLPPVKSGAYKVNSKMLYTLRYEAKIKHASNLGAIIAYEIANPLNIPAYIYDSVAVDEFDDIARISGLKEAPRESIGHALNMRAAAIKTAKAMNIAYSELNLIVAHIGGGISVSVHKKGKMVDLISDDEGPFAPERCGMIAGKDLISLCYENDRKTMEKKLKGNGGLVSYFGTSNFLEVVEKMNSGDEEAKIVLEAMAYQIAKAIGEVATVVNGEVDKIILTGGVAYSELLTNWISERVKFIAPIEILPGENELESLAHGTLRVLRGEEEARIFS